MAWTETYHCDVCGRAKSEDHRDWWLVSVETISPTPRAPEQSVLRLTPWNDFLAHSADVRHLCGARCSQTELDRWMTTTLSEFHG
jgi:hypothetical protein